MLIMSNNFAPGALRGYQARREASMGQPRSEFGRIVRTQHSIPRLEIVLFKKQGRRGAERLEIVLFEKSRVNQISNTYIDIDINKIDMGEPRPNLDEESSGLPL